MHTWKSKIQPAVVKEAQFPWQRLMNNHFMHYEKIQNFKIDLKLTVGIYLCLKTK